MTFFKITMKLQFRTELYDLCHWRCIVLHFFAIIALTIAAHTKRLEERDEYMHRVKKLTALILALLLCLGNVFLYVGEVRAEDFPAEEVTEEALTEEETAETAVSEEEMAEEEAEKTTEETSEEMTEETTEESAGEEAEETAAGTDEVVAASSLTGATMPTGVCLYLL